MHRKTSSLVFSLLAALTLFAVTGCGGGGGGSSSNGGSQNGGSNSSGGSNVTISAVNVSPNTVSVLTNKTTTVTALATGSDSKPFAVATSNWQWSIDNPSVASIAADGDRATLTGIAVGTAKVTVKDSASGTTGTADVTVTSTTDDPSGPGTVVYNNDFSNGAGPEWSKQNIDTTPGTTAYPATKFLGRFAKGTVSLSLANLPAHTTETIEFDLFIIDSMDGNNPRPDLGPDVWNLGVEGGPVLLNTTFSNISPALAVAGFPDGYFQAYPDSYPGGVHPYQSGAAQVGQLGYIFSYNGGPLTPSDSVYHLRYTFPHTASTVKLNFTSHQTQLVADESWGLKNVKVSIK